MAPCGEFLSPAEVAGRLVLGNAGFKEVFFFVQVDGFTHPGEWVFRFVDRFESDSFEAAIGDVLDVFPEHRGCEAEDSAR